MSQTIPLRDLLDFAIAVAWQAGKVTLEYFQTKFAVEAKADHSPVTIADRRTEQMIRGLIGARFPGHSIVGEEYGEQAGDSDYRWIIDPIDGTQSFVHGVPFYGVLLGLEVQGEPAVGVVNYPALGELLYAARGEGCYWNGQRARVSAVAELGQALFVTTDVQLFKQFGRAAAYDHLAAATRRQRTWGDCYGYALVATGRAEVMVDPVMNVWDCAPLLPILIEAGGTFTDWQGHTTIRGGDAVGTNGLVFDQVMRALAGPAGSAREPNSGGLG